MSSSRERLLRYLRACGPSSRWWLTEQGIAAAVARQMAEARLGRAELALTDEARNNPDGYLDASDEYCAALADLRALGCGGVG